MIRPGDLQTPERDLDVRPPAPQLDTRDAAAEPGLARRIWGRLIKRAAPEPPKDGGDRG